MYGGMFSAARTTSNVAATRSATAASHRATQEANKALSEVDDLKLDVEKLLMISEAMWTILKEQLGYEDEELMRRIEEIDMRDGVLDGKVKNTPNPPCPECGRTLIGKRPKCLYCGAEVKRDIFER